MEKDFHIEKVKAAYLGSCQTCYDGAFSGETVGGNS